jgi:cation diffusion facilitator CzcD-associated flavoprotein CzcO
MILADSSIGDMSLSPTELPVVIVGTGFSGIAMGVMLKRAGIESFIILEKADDIGGTWRENTYPGAACDVPSHLYSFSFEPKPDWSHAFSPQQEIQDYLRHCVKKYDLARHIRFGSLVTGAEFEEASGTWTVRVEGGDPIKARALVLGNGALHVASYPDIPGLESFAGAVFHSAHWDHGYDLEGKRVAVVGTGASAIQFVPEIASKVGSMHLFQRTAPWIVPKPDRPMRRWEHVLFRRIPPLQRLYRALIYWLLEIRAVGFVVNPRLMRFLETLARRHLAATVADPTLRAKLTPDYTIGCKRILLSNDYYQALQRPNVELVTDGIAAVTRTGIRTRDGAERPVDAIICGTGFSVADYLTRLDIVGRGGRRLSDGSHGKPATYLGITVNGFPNLFLLMGPNTGLGHNSMIFMIEAQARYALQAIQAVRRKRLSFLDVRESVQRAFNERLQAQMRHCVWSSGCRSWYVQDGYNSTIWPYFTFQYWWQTRRLALRDYELVGAPASEPRPVGLPAPSLAN